MFEKSYLIKAFYQWATDHHYEIIMKISTTHPSYLGNLTQDYIEDDGRAYVVISKNKIKYLEIEKDTVHIFKYGEEHESRKISIAIDGIAWLSANDEYLYLDHECGYVSAFIKNRIKEIQKIKEDGEEQRKKEKIEEERVEKEKNGMDPYMINEWVEKNKQKYIDMMHIDDWQIYIYAIGKNNPLSISNESTLGDCEKNYEYNSATIRLFSKNIPNENVLRRILVHELAHVAMASVNRYIEYIETIACLSNKQLEFAKKMEIYTHELLATKLERIILGKDADSGVIRYEENVNEKVISCLEEYTNYERPRIILMKDEKELVDKNEKNHSNIALNTIKNPKTPLQILKEEHEGDTDFWYSLYYEQVAKKIKIEAADNDKKILLNEPENKNLHYRKIILPDTKKAI